MDAVIDDRESPKPEDEDQQQQQHIPTKHHPSASMMLNMSGHQNSLNHHKTELRDDHVMQPISIPTMASRHQQPLLGKFGLKW